MRAMTSATRSDATVTVLDAFAVVALLREEPAAELVAGIVRSPTTLTSVNAAEVVDRLARRYGWDEDDVETDLQLLGIAGMEMIPVTVALGLEAGRLRTRYHDRDDAAISLADCVAAAAALHLERPIATADPALAAVVRAEAVGAQVAGGVGEAGHLRVLGREVRDRAEDEVDHVEDARRTLRGHVAEHHGDAGRITAGLGAQPRHHRHGELDARDDHPARGQRQGHPPGADRQLQGAPARLRQGGQQVDRVLGGRIAPVVVGRRDLLVEVVLRARPGRPVTVMVVRPRLTSSRAARAHRASPAQPLTGACPQVAQRA